MLKDLLWIRQILVASLAGGTAWFIGNQLGGRGGIVAAIVCTLTVRISLHRSLREGFGQILGNFIGAVVATITVHYLGLGFFSIALTILVCSILAATLRLGSIASVNVPVVAMIIIGPDLSESTVAHRLGATLVGAITGIVFSYFSHPKTPIDRTYELLNKLGLQGAAILAEMSEGVASNYTQSDAGHWLARSRSLVRQLPELRLQIGDAKGYTRWIRVGQREEAEKASRESLAIEHTLVQIRVIARTLFDASLDAGIADIARKETAVALSAANYALTAHIEDPEEIIGAPQSPTADLRQATDALTQILVSQKSSIAKAQIVKGLAVVSNIEIIADSLDFTSPALNDEVEEA
ncbi:Aromatic acid exporter family member 1 [Candidatus Nanopelagicaceae bacterium]